MSEGADRVDVVVVGVSEASHARTVQLASELSVLSGKPKGDVQFALLGGQFVVHRGMPRLGARTVAERLRELGAEIETRPSALDAPLGPEESHSDGAVPPDLEPDRDHDLPTAPTVASMDPPSGAIELGPPPDFGDLKPSSKPESKPVPTHRHNKRPTGELDPARPHGRLEESQAEWPFAAEARDKSKGSSAGPRPTVPPPKKAKADSSEDLPRRVRPSSRAEKPPTRSSAGSIDPRDDDERIPTGPFDTVDATMSESVEVRISKPAVTKKRSSAGPHPRVPPAPGSSSDPLDLAPPPTGRKARIPGSEPLIEVDYAAAGVSGPSIPSFGPAPSPSGGATIVPAASSSSPAVRAPDTKGPRPRTIPPGRIPRRLLGTDSTVALILGVVIGLVVSTFLAYEVARRVTREDTYNLEDELARGLANPAEVEDGTLRSPSEVEDELDGVYTKTRMWFWVTWLVGIPLGIGLGRIRLN